MPIETILVFSLAAYYVIGLGGAIYFYWPASSSPPAPPSSEIELQTLNG